MATSSELVAKRYAKALWLLADGKETAAAWLPSLEALTSSIEGSDELHSFLKSPAFALEQKWPVLEAILAGVKSPTEVNNFLRFVLKAGRFDAIPEMTNAFRESVLEANDTVEAQIDTALPLSDAQTRAIAEKLQKMTGKKVVVTTFDAPELLAGIRVHLQGKTLDSSLAQNLQTMQQVLLQAEA